ncbi:MAG: hypothetical protein DHS20C15_30740 [Planctomycetota bacterium]|nr:MAG: hypothetical protein DHS20C15_30740 [Planctomycetota bacterium]
MRRAVGLNSILLLATLGFARAAAADTLHVPTDHVAIQAALVAAQPGDTVLVAPGTYAENLDFLGKALTLRSEAGPEHTILDAGGLDHGVRFENGETPDALLQGFTVRNVNPTPGHHAVFVNGASPTLRDLILRDNHISGGMCGEILSGGGLALIDSATQAFNLSVTDNSLVAACTKTFLFSPGIVVRGDSNVLIDGGEVRRNITGFGVPLGGGVTVTGGHATLRGLAIEKNSQTGILVTDFGPGPTPSALLEDCRLVRNGVNGSVGNGVEVSSGEVVLRRCVLARNSASGAEAGGGGALTLEHCTVWGNTFSGVTGFFLSPPPVLRHCIVWNDDVGAGSSASMDINYSVIAGGWPGVGNLDADPLLRDPAAGDFTLLGGSPAIDAGDPLAPLDPDGSLGDLGAHTYTPWFALGHALPDGPRSLSLTGVGSLRADTPLTLQLERAEPHSSSHLVIGFANAELAFHGGVLVPAPDVLLLNLPVNTQGAHTLHATWPAGVPSAFSFWAQHWQVCDEAPLGFVASNALVGTTP